MTELRCLCFWCGSSTPLNQFMMQPIDSVGSKSEKQTKENILHQWRTSSLTSLCTTLDLEYGAFERTFAGAQFCLRCQELIFHADFTVNTIARLHLKLRSIKDDLQTLLRDHYKSAVNLGGCENESDLSTIHNIIRNIGLKAEDHDEELQTVQLCELVQNEPEEDDFDLISPSISSQRLKELKRRHANALKSKSRACKILSRKTQKQNSDVRIQTNSNGETPSDSRDVADDDANGSECTDYQPKISARIRKSNFKCKKCKLSFQDSWKLRRHLRTSAHLEDLPRFQKSSSGLMDQLLTNPEDENGDTSYQSAGSNTNESDFCGRSDDFCVKIENNSEDDVPTNTRCAKRILRRRKSNTASHSPSAKRKYECLVCHARFCDGWKLRRHTESTVHSSRSSSQAASNRLPRTISCSYCEKKFATEEILANHIRLNHREKYHNCVFCNAKHNDRKSYMEHLNESHPEQKTHLCQVCGKTFFFFSDLRYHSRYHQDEKIPVQCFICNMILPSEILLKSHQLSRHPEGAASSMYTCPIEDCSLRFSTAAGVQAHVRYLHAKRNDFECSFPGCGKRFGLQTKLDIHFVTHSAGTHLCPVPDCGKKYRHKKDLKSHMERVHPTDTEAPQRERFPCPVCGKTYFRRDILRRHIVLKNHYGNNVLNTGTAPPPEAIPIGDFECHICCMILVDEVALKRHYFTHDNNESRPFACPECQKRFSDEKKVTAHIKRSHRGGFGCEICGKRFARNNRLRLHMLAHSDVREHSCETCGKEYKHHRDLMLHMNREHTGDKYKFPCPACDKLFARSDLLRYHQVRKHGISAPAELQPSEQPEILTCSELDSSH